MNAVAPSHRVTRREWGWVALVSLIILSITIAPNLAAAATTPANMHYTGFLYNWEEANPYLAKIVQGQRGDWLYSLPYSADPGPPFFLYFNYILLGHVAALLSVEPIIIFHAARVLGSATLLVSLYAFGARFFTDVWERRLAFLLSSVGSGVGWLLIGSGYLTADFWQTQLYPFLSMLANVHFPLAMASFLWVIDALIVNEAPDKFDIGRPRVLALLVFGTLILATTQPYALVVAAPMAAAWAIVHAVRHRRMPYATLMRVAILCLIAAPFAFYYRWLATNNASYAGWDAQNLTPASPWWDYALSGGVPLLFAVLGMAVMVRSGQSQNWSFRNRFILLTWLAFSIILVYLPFSQQRRFAFALFIPVAFGATYGLRLLPAARARFYSGIVVGFSTLTNIILLLVACAALAAHAPYLYLSQAEWSALLFLRDHAAASSVVLASPELSLYIPAWSGQRVIYGHPHETLNAKAHLEEVRQFFRGGMSDTTGFLKPVSYIIVGPREDALGKPAIGAPFTPIYTSGDVTIYGRP